MQSTIRLGRVAGIPVGVHWSLLLIGTLLAVQVQQALDEVGTGGVVGWVAAIVLVVAFYAGLVAHELGHALVARRSGVETVGITLWMLGGVARLAGDSPSPAAEARMALAGPGVSAALAGFWALIGWAADLASAPQVVADVAWTLAVLNVVLAVFNLLPAFPLDGGRVLRAGLWAWRRDRVRGTDAAARVGLVIGVAGVIGGAVVGLVAGDPVSGLWFALLGVFVVQAGRTEVRFVRAAVVAAADSAGARCDRPPVLDPALPADEMLAHWPLDDDHPTYLVGPPGRPEGFLLVELLSLVRDAGSRPLGEVALPWALVPVVDAAAPAEEAAAALVGSRFRRVRVRLPDGDLGVLRAADLERRAASSSSSASPSAAPPSVPVRRSAAPGPPSRGEVDVRTERSPWSS